MTAPFRPNHQQPHLTATTTNPDRLRLVQERNMETDLGGSDRRHDLASSSRDVSDRDEGRPSLQSLQYHRLLQSIGRSEGEKWREA